MHTNTETACATLTFKIGRSFARHIVLYYFKILQYIRESQPGQTRKHAYKH